jgi:Tol biopolymer transport system component
VDLDGGNPKQLTRGFDRQPECGPDGNWVVYQSVQSGKPSVWKVPIDGGQPTPITTPITDKPSDAPVISPDGKLVAYYLLQDAAKAPSIAVSSFEGGGPVKTFEMPQTTLSSHFQWSTDGLALTYVDTQKGASNIWSQPLSGGPPKKLTDFRSDQIFSFAWSPDGKQLALARGTETSDVVLIRDFK